MRPIGRFFCKKGNMIKFFIKISQTSYCIFSYFILKIFNSLDVKGQENLKKIGNESFIFTSNHNSYIDSGISAAVLLTNGSFFRKIAPVKFLVMDKYFSWKIFPIRIFLEAMGAVKISKAKVKYADNKHLNSVLDLPLGLLRQGGRVWIYPEGGFNNNGTPKKPRVGAAFLHQQTGAPILPVRIIGNDNVMSKAVPFLPKLSTLFGLNKIKVIIGKPIYFFENMSLEEVTDKIMNTIYELKEKPALKEVKLRKFARQRSSSALST
ncbi:TPA: hypothetical protein DEW47_00740 [Patescibacteria group bacterium]|nr:hypothetical protein [Patescibacteria group bacterium]HCI04497.1 hypothetical protein [Patescibacteria group bacterium]